MNSVSDAKAQPDSVIRLTRAEIQSGSDRQQWAEGLILQLPPTHDGRNSWLMNYGTSDTARRLRAKHFHPFNELSRAINPPADIAPPDLRDPCGNPACAWCNPAEAVQLIAGLKAALSKALAYCDDAWPPEQYRDEREALYRALR
jgi:hypothetical protein